VQVWYKKLARVSINLAVYTSFFSARQHCMLIGRNPHKRTSWKLVGKTSWKLVSNPGYEPKKVAN